MATTDGGPAFPVPSAFIPAPPGHPQMFINTADYGCQPLSGMTLRDYFAAAALASTREPNCGSYDEQARTVYMIADAMLMVRERSDDR